MKMEMMFNTGGERPDEMNDESREKVAQYVNKRVGGLRCPDHDKPPTVICSGDSLSSLTFEVEGCCQKIIHIVRTKLES